MAAVGTDHQVGPVVAGPCGGVGAHAADAAILANQVACGCAQGQLKRRVLFGLIHQHPQQGRLGDEGGLTAKGCGGNPAAQLAAQVELHHVDGRLGQAFQLVAQPHLPDGVNGAQLQPFAPEGAGEVVMFFQQGHRNTAACQQESERGPGGAGSHDQRGFGRHDTRSLTRNIRTVTDCVALRIESC